MMTGRVRAGRLMISAAGSGSGKSVITMGLLQALKDRGVRVQSYKCGPDYIDPAFHARVLGAACRNLDTYLMGDPEVLDEVSDAERSGLLAVAEGAMGLYDGLGGSLEHSAYSIAVLCGMPVMAVVDAGGSVSVESQLRRLLDADEQSMISAVLVNRCSSGEYQLIKSMLVREISGRRKADGGEEYRISLCGYLPVMEEAVFPSRHLGLVGAAEAENFALRVKKIAAEMEKNGCIDAVLAAIMDAPSINSAGVSAGLQAPMQTAVGGHACAGPAPHVLPMHAGHNEGMVQCSIAVARDEAFLFTYQRALENLQRAGAVLQFFSPVHDSNLPEGADGLYLPGGYPELYASMLEENVQMRKAVKKAVIEGMPTVAECGGFMYLGEVLYDSDGKPCRMAGALPGRAKRQRSLVRFGYLELEQAAGSSLLFKEGCTAHAHEFHYWDSTHNGDDLAARKRSKNMAWRCGHTGESLYAAFPHLYMNAEMAGRFVSSCRKYRDRKRQGAAASAEAFRRI